MLAHDPQALPDVVVQPGVHERDVPVVDVRLQHVDARAAVRQHEVVGHRLAVGQEEVLDGLGLVAEAQHEVGEAEVRVVLHDVPQHRAGGPTGIIGLGDDLRGFAHAQPLPAAEDHDLHRTSTSRDRDHELGAPGAARAASWDDDLVLQVPGQDQDEVRAGPARARPGGESGSSCPAGSDPACTGCGPP